MKLKKVLAVTLAAVMTMSMAACGDDAAADNGTAAEGGGAAVDNGAAADGRERARKKRGGLVLREY